MKYLPALMLTAIMAGSAVAAPNNSSDEDAQQGPRASSFVLVGGGLVGVALWLKRTK